MQQQLIRRNTVLFVGFLLLAGVIQLLNDAALTPSPLARAAMFTVNSLIYMGLLIFWIQSVYTRLLPSRVRIYLIVSAVLMALFLLLRAVRYRIALGDFALRYLWYAYYLPMTMIPALFLAACVCIRRGNQAGKWDERRLLIPSGLLAALVLTNDLHHLVFRPLPDVASLAGTVGTYAYGPLFYLLYGCIILFIAAGVILLLRQTGQGGNRRKTLYTGLCLLFWVFMNVSHVILSVRGLRLPFEAPEIHIFCLLLVFEVCIRMRLFPHNENYQGIFSALRQPALICDQNFTPVYRTAAPVPADKEQMKAALSADVYLWQDQHLLGKAIRGGFAFWTADESALRRLNEDLEEASQVLSEENNLIEEERKLKEEKARMEARNRLYLKAAEQVYPTQKKIAALLKTVLPDQENLRPVMAQVMVLNAYAKRRINFVLAQTAAVTAYEMKLALEETGRYLPYCGTEAYVDCAAAQTLPYPEAMDLYDTFEAVIENLLPFSPPYLLIAYSDEGLRLMAQGTPALALPNTPLPASMEKTEDGLTVRLALRKGEKA